MVFPNEQRIPTMEIGMDELLPILETVLPHVPMLAIQIASAKKPTSEILYQQGALQMLIELGERAREMVKTIPTDLLSEAMGKRSACAFHRCQIQGKAMLEAMFKTEKKGGDL